MFFGAGNVIFPLAVGKVAGDMNVYATAGLIITAAAMPVLGLYGMILYHGNIREYFGRLGKIPGFLISCIIIFLLGPLGSTPRCITLSYSTLLKNSVLDISPVLFSAVACISIYFICMKRSQILNILGKFLTPILILSLGSIICVGLFKEPSIPISSKGGLELFSFGMIEGYKTMDLLAAFFFSSTIISLLRRMFKEGDVEKIALKSSCIGILLLALVYVGFSTIAAYHAHDLGVDNESELLSAITMKIAGPLGGVLVRITVALACLTTAVILITSFTEFFRREVLREKISYNQALAIALSCTFFVTTFDYSGISAFLGPILNICYPALIVLTLLNIANKIFKFTWVKTPVYATLALTVLYQLISNF